MPTDTTDTTDPATPDLPPPSPTGDAAATVLPPDLVTWVHGAAANGWTKVQARSWLHATGWSGPAVDLALDELASVAPAPRFEQRPPPPERAWRHGLAYSVLLWGLGLAALSAGSSLHLLLGAALADRGASWMLANWLTLFLCTIPFFLYARHQVVRIEEEDPLARLSPTRHVLSLVLLWAAAIVGIVRLLVFVHQTVTDLVVERSTTDLLPNLANVSVVVLIAGGVYLWTWRFRHPEPVS